jgi:hypothetical protein
VTQSDGLIAHKPETAALLRVSDVSEPDLVKTSFGDVDDDGIAGAKLTDPLAALIAEDLVDHLSGAEKHNPDPLNGDQGSTMTALVVKRCSYSNSKELRQRLAPVND